MVVHVYNPSTGLRRWRQEAGEFEARLSYISKILSPNHPN
jgi:hypothetical protein